MGEPRGHWNNDLGRYIRSIEEFDTSWKDDAACLGVDPELFFPERGESTRPAKAVCATCRVRQQCLDYALEFGIKFGIFGGKSERERRQMRSKTRREAA